MSKYRYCLFDFDGTLFDTSEGIIHSFDVVIQHYNLDPSLRSFYSRMIGPPLKYSFMKYFGFPEEQIDETIKVYRSYYNDKGLFECKTYDGVEEMLSLLRSKGFKLYVATSKPEVYAVKLLKEHKLDHYFDFIGGSDFEEHGRVTKTDVLRYIISGQNLEDKKNECLLIGDTHFDVDGAKEVGIDCLGVLYGFGTKESLLEAGAIDCVQTPAQVADFLVME